MARTRLSFIIIVAAFALSACVGDSSQPNDGGGGDVTVSDAAPDVMKGDAGPSTCVFGTSHFGDGCKFQP